MMRGLKRSWSLPVILILSLSYLCCNLSEARNHHQKHPSAVVVGAVYCDTCFRGGMPKGSHYISGATVAVECAEGSTRPAFHQEVTTDKQGNFRVHLPFSVSKHVKEIEGCTVKLVKSSEPYCAVASTASSSLIRLKERKDGKHIYSAGFFTFKPLKQPGLCNQQPSVTKSQLNSLGDMLAPLPVGPLPVPVPLVPTAPNVKLLPNLPLLNPERPLPSVPKLPNMPLPATDKSAKVSKYKFTPVPQRLQSRAEKVSKKSLKPSVTKSRLNSLGDMLPPLPNTDIPGLLTPDLPPLPPLPVAPLPVPLPLVPTAPNAPLLPNLPLPNPELPLPPLPPFSGLPVRPTDRPAEVPKRPLESTEDSKVENGFVSQPQFFFFPPIVGSPSGGLPTIPNPLQPPPLLPNPLQPPPTPLIPNPFQPPSPPSIVPGVPGLPTIPGVPGLPNVPGVPGLPTIPGIPGVPGLPTIPVLTPPPPPPPSSILPPLLPPGFGFPGIPPATKTTKMNP